MANTTPQTGYAPVNNFNMYYEIHGSGQPLVVLHGGAPNPDDFPALVAKMKQLDLKPFAWPQEDIRGIEAPTLLIIGDSEAIRLEHAVQMFRLLGGGVMGDLNGLPKSHLAVLPGTAHFLPPGSGLMDRTDWLVSMIGPFLDAPIPERERAAGGGA
jgi:pimeloyl-ACP methyl ester carboxylesterase